MFKNTLLPDTLRAIKLVSKIPVLQRAYLAGGTALALQIGHRISVDLDFFTQEDFDENILEKRLNKSKVFRLEGKAWKTVWGWIGQTKFSIFYYEYKIIDKLIDFEGIKLLSKSDISAMKINAVETRGTKRDFIDLFFLSKEFTLDQMIEFYGHKYGNLENHIYSIVRSFSYFEDAEIDKKAPQMLMDVFWDEVKSFFTKESIRLAKLKLNL